MVSHKETPLVIWKSLNPCCFKCVNRKTLPVEYHANKKAWMTSGIFETWLKKFDKHMGRKGRKVLLFLDDATSHSDVQLCNVKLKFLPPNTTSILQPLDQRIIAAMKRKYHKTQLQYMITQMGKSKEKDCSQLLKEINVLKAIYWIKQAWNDVKSNTIAKCFKKCGFVESTAKNLVEELFDAVVDELREIDANNEESGSDDDDSDEIDFNLAAEKVLNHSINELIEAESLLKTSYDAEINWEANTCDIIEALEEKEKAESEEEREDATDDYSTDPLISSYPTALITYLKQFLMNTGFTDMVEDLSKVGSKLEKEFVKQQQRATQTSITDFLDSLR